MFERDGFISLEVIGKNLNQLKNEAGGHRIQRVPPTERKGRVHTSTVTVAVLDGAYSADSKYSLREDHHYFFEIFKSQGAGGQSRNKTSSGVKCIHLPTGITQERTEKCQHANRKNARIAVDKLLDSLITGEMSATQNNERSDRVGSGMRGDKIRTYRFQEDLIIDHQTDKKFNLKQAFRGNFDKFWK